MENILIKLFLIVIFINSFGIFCNLYHLLIGIYFTLAALILKEHFCLHNIFPLILNLHALNFGNILTNLHILANVN